jgi:TRAP-type C4-dicarboxylate transport system permease small subunit
MNRGGHIIVDFFVSHFPTNVRRILSLVSDTLVLGLLAFLLFQGWAVVRVTMYNLSPAMQMPMGYVYSVLPLSAGLLAINTVRVAYRHWQGDFGPWNP